MKFFFLDILLILDFISPNTRLSNQFGRKCVERETLIMTYIQTWPIMTKAYLAVHWLI